MRFSSRHVHKTIADFIETRMVALGWQSSPAPFGTVPVIFKEFEPDEPNPVEILPNTVSITLGDETGDELLQLGGGLWQATYPLFVDVYGVNFSIARSIASDVKDVIADVYMPVLDFTASNLGVATAERLSIERESILVERPAAAADAKDIRKNWRVVKAMIEVTFQDGAVVVVGGFGAGLYGEGGYGQ